jgi:hypothetical protein
MIKTLLASSVALGLILSAAPAPAFAQTSTTTATVELQTMLQQIKQLQDQLAELMKKRGDTVTELREAIAVAAELRAGMTSEEVKALQEILAADPDIYPEGIVSGFYGPLTAKAVAKFQKKHGIEGEASVGMKTRARLNALANDKDFRCKAWGKLIAPGQAKKRLGTAEVDLSVCAHVPGGILKKLDGDWKTGTSTATSTDTRAPGISNIEIDDVTEESALVSWETNERTKATVWYSTDEDIDLDDAEKETSSTFALEHDLTLEDLEEDTEYFFMIVATDKAGNTATSSVEDFETESD